MRTPLLTIRDLDVWYQSEKPVLSKFSLTLKKGEVVGLIGLNGAGKTTFLKTLSGLHEKYHVGEARWYDHPIRFRDREFKRCRYTVFAEDNSFQYFTFREYLSYVSAAYGRKTEDASSLMRGFHFEEYRDVLLKDLSTGNRKKVFLITAFALRPELLLLDEPVNGLDFQSTEFLYSLIAGYREHGTVLFSSHILESVTLTSDRVLVLDEGKIRQTFENGAIDAGKIREALRYEDVV